MWNVFRDDQSAVYINIESLVLFLFSGSTWHNHNFTSFTADEASAFCLLLFRKYDDQAQYNHN